MYSDACDAEASKGLPWVWTLTKIIQYNKYISRYNSIKSLSCLQVAVTTIVCHTDLIWIVNDHRPELERTRQIIHRRDNGKGNRCLSDTISNLCLNHPNLQHANSCKHMSQEPLDCFLRPGRSICTWGSVRSSANPAPVISTLWKKTIPWKCQSVLPAATGTQTPGLMLIAKALWIWIILSPQKSLFAEATYPSLVAMKVNTHLCLFTLWKYKYIYTYSFTFNRTKYNVVHTLELNEFF